MRATAEGYSLPGRRRRRRGAVAVFFALLAPPVALCVLALVVDVGSFYATKAWLQAIADTAVLTCAASLDASQPLASQELQARTVITRTARANGLDPVTFTVTMTEGADNRWLTVTADAAYAMPTLFAAALGLDRVTIGVHAAAGVTPGAAPLPRRAHLTE